MYHTHWVSMGTFTRWPIKNFNETIISNNRKVLFSAIQRLSNMEKEKTFQKRKKCVHCPCAVTIELWAVCLLYQVWVIVESSISRQVCILYMAFNLEINWIKLTMVKLILCLSSSSSSAHLILEEKKISFHSDALRKRLVSIRFVLFCFVSFHFSSGSWSLHCFLNSIRCVFWFSSIP